MAQFNVARYSSERFEGGKALWRQAFPDDSPWNAAEVAIPAELAAQPQLLLIAREGALVVGSIIAGYDGHRGWLYAVAVLSFRCREGVAARGSQASDARIIRRTQARLISPHGYPARWT